MKKEFIAVVILLITLLCGCETVDNVEKHAHIDSFYKLDVTEKFEEQTPSTEITVEDIFKEPTVNIDEIYDIKSESKLEDTVYTDSEYIDYMIEDLKTQGGYTEVKILNTWYDDIEKAKVYDVMFDDNAIYFVKVTDDNKVYASEVEYNIYYGIEDGEVE